MSMVCTKREVYKLDCHSCCQTVELPAGKPPRAELLRCPHCGAELEIAWREVGRVPGPEGQK